VRYRRGTVQALQRKNGEVTGDKKEGPVTEWGGKKRAVRLAGPVWFFCERGSGGGGPRGVEGSSKHGVRGGGTRKQSPKGGKT